MGMPRRFWQDMSSEEFAKLDAARVIAVLPVAAIEQHGPHLPVATDACINRGVLTRALELMPADLPVTILPLLPVGKSNEHLAFPGTLSLSAETLIRVWTEVGEGVARTGIRKLVLFNSHGGQPQIMDIVARRHDGRGLQLVRRRTARRPLRRRRDAARYPCRRDRDLDDAASAV